MPEEVGGTLSTFGQQVSSNKPTQPRAKFGTGGRTERVAEKPFEFKLLGAFGNKYASDNDMGKESRPGPGQYDQTSAVGKQVLSANPTGPTWKVGNGQRFGQYKNIFKDDFSTPSALNPKLSAGWIGDAPNYSFHGKGKRSDVAHLLPGNKPTFTEDPGPGTYEPPSSLGLQHDSRKTSVPRCRLGTADRDKSYQTQYLSADHEKMYYGKHSPAPNAYNPHSTLVSTVKASSSFKFGSSDRFSQVRAREAPSKKRLPGFNTPGPGTYVI